MVNKKKIPFHGLTCQVLGRGSSGKDLRWGRAQKHPARRSHRARAHMLSLLPHSEEHKLKVGKSRRSERRTWHFRRTGGITRLRNLGPAHQTGLCCTVLYVQYRYVAASLSFGYNPGLTSFSGRPPTSPSARVASFF